MFSILFLYLTVLSDFTSLSNGNAESVNSSQIMAMILRQAELCPYISLCTKSNTSEFGKKSIDVPCCQECSCESTCITQGTCCPDFYNDWNNTDLLTSKENTTHFSRKRKECGKTNFGNLPNDTGYVMITSCPDNYTDDHIRAGCESNWDISKTVIPQTPVSDTVSGLTYKNKYCERCNSDGNKSSIPWDAWLECGATNFLFPYYIMRGPLELAMLIVSPHNGKRSCRLAFYPKIEINRSLTDFEVCKVNDIISTCSGIYSDSKYTKLCTHYSWPVKISFGAETFKNYACMLCNGKEFRERCMSPVKVDFAVSLNVNIEEKDLIHTTNGNNSETHAHLYDSRKTDRVFPNEAGFVHCPKGYIYDSKRVRCRHVLCPLYFYIQKGKCGPMFGMMRGIYYSIYLEMLVPHSLRLAQQESIEKSVSSRLYSFLCENVGEMNFEFYLWSGQSAPGIVDITKPYLIVLRLSGNVYGGNYASVLTFFNTFVLRDKSFNISIRVGDHIKDETMNVHFSTSVYFDGNLKPIGPFHLAKTNRGGKLDFDKGKEIHIAEESLCFRLLLLDQEYRRTLGHISILETKYVLFRHSFTDYNKHGEKLTLICLNKAFHDIPDVISNVFFDDETVSFQYAPMPNVNDQDKQDVIGTSSDAPNEASVETVSQRSITATLCTIALIVFIIVIRLTIKTLLRRDNIRSVIEVNRN